MLKRYLSIARADHWVKNLLILPGTALALVIDPTARDGALLKVALGFCATCLLASANYTINEFLDAKTDRHHPTKSNRPAVRVGLSPAIVFAQYLLLVAAGLGIATRLNPVFLYAGIALLVMGVTYNVKPVRSKDIAYIDVLSESINNPIRLVLGWAAVSTIILPPSSLLLSYWMGGAYLMAMKRYAEIRLFSDREMAGAYRQSFRHYTEESLMLSSFFYALTATFFLGIFLIKYKIEFVLSFPFLALMFVWYQRIAIRANSTAVSPEKLYREPRFLAYVGFVCALIALLFFIEVPILHPLMDHSVLQDFRIQ